VISLAALKIRHRLMAFPLLAVGTLVATVSVAFWAQRDNARQLTQIRTQYVPQVVLGQRLLAQLDRLQQAYANSASAQDRELLGEADAILAGMKGLLDGREGAPLGEARRKQLEEALDGYGAAAHSLAEGLLSGGDAVPRIAQMQARLTALRGLLKDGLATDELQMAAAFDVAARELARSNWILVGILLLSALLSALVGFWVMVAVSRPLERLTSAARRIAHEQDLTQRVEVRSADELGELGGAFDAMVEHLREIMAALKQSVASLDAAAGDMKSLAAADTEAWHRHAQHLGDLTRQTTLLAQSSTVAADRAHSVLQATERAESLGGEGRQAVEATHGGLEAIRADVGGLVTQIGQMVQHASLAGSVLGEVQELAKQSNVVALNASIEAARGGEAGIAFAVVAREMRRLADESSKSTQRIGRTLRELVGAARALQEISRASDERIRQSDERVRSSGQSLQQLAGLYAESGAAAREIVGAVSEQDTGIAKVSDGLRALDASMAQSVESVRKLEDSSQTLSQASASLSQLLEQFRL
jgi:methyl-accepting chemotaxis protein